MASVRYIALLVNNLASQKVLVYYLLTRYYMIFYMVEKSGLTVITVTWTVVFQITVAS